MLRILFSLVLITSPNLHAVEPWRAPSQSWTQQDADRLLRDSPWALAVEATMDDPADRPDNGTALPTEAQSGLPSNAKMGATQRWDGGIAKNRMGHLATIPVVVRWESAEVVRQALAMKHDPDAAALDTAAKENFVVTVIGLLPKQAQSQATLRQKSSSDDKSRARTTEETLEWFMTNTRLLVKGGRALEPRDVKIDPATGAVRVFFQRDEMVIARKRDVVFVTRYGTMNVEAKFRTKDMVLNKQPDL